MDKTADLGSGEPSSEEFWFRILRLLTVMWLIAYLPYWFTWDWLFADLAGVLAALAGVPGALIWLLAAAFLRSKRMLMIGLSMMVLTMVVLCRVGEAVKAHATLMLHQDSFSNTVAEVKRDPDKWKEVGRINGVSVDSSGAEVRVAFDLGGGFMGDYPSIVFDPTGQIHNPSYGEMGKGFPFDGQYHTVRHLKGPWYFASMFPD